MPRKAFTASFVGLTTIFVSLTSLAPPALLGQSANTSKPHGIIKENIHVETIAGNGTSGTDNGPSNSADFVLPYGVAVSRDGSIYVADPAAQLIRRIRNGAVVTYAGEAALDPKSGDYGGAYVDGPVAIARFNEPTGIAVSKSGAVYVADAKNHAVRMISNGLVTTVAGGPSKPPGDGASSIAGFQNPRSVSVDDDNNIYIADFGVGIRIISASGIVTTIANSDKNVYAVSARGSGRSLEVAYTSDLGIHFTSSVITEFIKPDREREPTGEGLDVGHPFGIAVTGPDSAVITDILHSAVRFIRVGNGNPTVKTLAGDSSTLDVGSFADGDSESARVDVPLALAVADNGRIIFSDAGNRRVRSISSLNTRSPIIPQNIADLRFPKGALRVALIGNSFVFPDVMWLQSTPGQLEAQLNESRRASANAKPVAVQCVQLNGTGLGTQKDFITQYLGEGEVDLVILLYNDFAQSYDLQARPDIASGDKWKTVVRADLQGLSKELSEHSTKLLVVYVPDGYFVSYLERTVVATETAGGPDLSASGAGQQAAVRENENVYASSGVPFLTLYDSMRAFEAKSDRYPLFNTRDEHPSSLGAAWIGREIARKILRDHLI